MSPYWMGPTVCKLAYPDITLSSLAETGQAELTVPVLNQRFYIGQAITSTLANTPCEDLRIGGGLCGRSLDPSPMLTPSEVTVATLSRFEGRAVKMQSDILAMLEQRSYTRKAVIISTLANTSCTDLSVDEVIRALGFRGIGRRNMVEEATNQSEILPHYDFGTAYAHLRSGYGYRSFSLEDALRCLKRDWEQRRNLVVDNRITDWIASPRRVWDLRANRVVPWWVVNTWPWGISHAWMCDEERVDVMTPINGYEWPVPIPKGANLDLVRIEMLSLGAEYAWLDVLCLRQAGGTAG
ncbi:hypothetical protein F5146DRAFT_770171 [Armillaria mellea]|nr:hypothetical protein F5146DRAFT_770171 [Armillaria mellea]